MFDSAQPIVLIVEDIAVVKALAKKAVTNLSIPEGNIIMADNLDNFAEVTGRVTPDIVILDHNLLGKVTGSDFIKRLIEETEFKGAVLSNSAEESNTQLHKEVIEAAAKTTNKEIAFYGCNKKHTELRKALEATVNKFKENAPQPHVEAEESQNNFVTRRRVSDKAIQLLA